MHTASDACACSGEICQPDPSLFVDPADIIEESDPADATVHDVTIEIADGLTPPPIPDPDPEGLLGMMVPGPDLEPNDLAFLIPRRSFGGRRALIAIALGAATLAGILVAVGAQQQILAPVPAALDVPEPNLSAVRAIVSHVATPPASAAPAPAPAAVKAKRSVRRSSRRQRARRHLARARRALRRHRWKRARRHARRALRLDRRNRQARRLEQRATARLERQNRAIARQLRAAQRAMRRHQWRRAKRQASAVLRVAPRNRRARAIKRRAEARLRRRG